MARKNFYVVTAGWNIGIFDSAEKATRQTNGYPNAKMQGFVTEEEAIKYYESAFGAVTTNSPPNRTGSLPSAGAYYAVGIGRMEGIYTSEEACKAQVKNYPNAFFKKCKSLEEAQIYLEYVLSQIVYAVIRGRRVGLYKTLDECMEQVADYPDGYYEKFPSERAAKKHLAEKYEIYDPFVAWETEEDRRTELPWQRLDMVKTILENIFDFSAMTKDRDFQYDAVSIEKNFAVLEKALQAAKLAFLKELEVRNSIGRLADMLAAQDNAEYAEENVNENMQTWYTAEDAREDSEEEDDEADAPCIGDYMDSGDKSAENDIEIYVDGSYAKGVYGWSFAVFEYGCLKEQGSGGGFFSAKLGSGSQFSELEAAQNAIRFAARKGIKKFTLCYDCSSIEDLAQREIRPSDKKFLADYINLLKPYLDNITFKHVRGHSGNMGNELAHNLAKREMTMMRSRNYAQALSQHLSDFEDFTEKMDLSKDVFYENDNEEAADCS